MAEELQTCLGIEPVLTAGSGGVFDVEIEGKLVFSKHEKGRFPEDAEIADLLKKEL